MILSIDPGRSKFGWAVVDPDGTLLLSGISKVDDLVTFLKKIFSTELLELDGDFLEGKLESILNKNIEIVFVGDGTGKDLFSIIERFALSHVISVGEEGSTLEARKIYWRLHPPRGVRRLIPLSLQVPPRDIDDLAAYEIALRGLSQV